MSMTKKHPTSILNLLTLFAAAVAAPLCLAQAQAPADGSNSSEGGGVSARQARANSRGGDAVVREKVEVYTKGTGEKLSGDDVRGILDASAKEYGVVWKENITPAAEDAVNEFAAALGASREAVEAAAREAASGGTTALNDATYAGGVAKKEIAKTADDAKYAVNAGSREMRTISEDIGKAARTTADDIAFAVNSSRIETEGVMGMVAATLGCTTDELADVAKVFGKEATAVFNEIASLPEWQDLKEGARGFARDAKRIWVSEGGDLVATLGGGGTRVVVGQAQVQKTAGDAGETGDAGAVVSNGRSARSKSKESDKNSQETSVGIVR